MSNVKPSKSGKYLTSEEWDAFKAAGITEEELQADQPFGPIIFSYTRAQAIEDGVLVDVTDLARRAGFKVSTVMTCGLVAELVEAFGPGCIEATKFAVLRQLYKVVRALPEDQPAGPRIDMKIAHIDAYSLMGPGDNGEPVLTIMLDGED